MHRRGFWGVLAGLFCVQLLPSGRKPTENTDQEPLTYNGVFVLPLGFKIVSVERNYAPMTVGSDLRTYQTISLTIHAVEV